MTRLQGSLIGLTVAVADTAVAHFFDLRFQIGGKDATWIVFLYLASSYAAVGYLIGELRERRRKERQLEARAQAQEKLATLGTVAAAVAHEVRNPLAIIRSTIQNAKEAPETLAQASDVICDEIDRLTQVTTTLLGFARAPTPEIARVSTMRLFAQIAALARPMLQGTRCELDVAPDDVGVLADPALLVQASLALVQNAKEAMPNGGKIMLSAGTADGGVEIRVTDEGPGVSDPARLFHPLVTTKSSGHGLGLAIAKRLIEAQRGSIRLEKGRGAIFCITLPRA